MPKLNDDRKELFCELVARGDISVQEACWRAGYRQGSGSQVPTSYHSQQGSRLLDQPVVAQRVAELTVEYAENKKKSAEDTIRGLDKEVIEFLVGVLKADYTKYFESKTVVLPNGRPFTCFTLKTDIQNWSLEDRKYVTGFDSQGRPKFADKQWAIEKLLPMTGLSKKGLDVEDLLGLFNRAGLMGADLPEGSFTDEV